MAIDKQFYNQASSEKLGWEPDWFGADYIDDDLVKKVKKWQRDRGLTADGLVGPMTYRRIWTERDEQISVFKPKVYSGFGDKKHIVHNGKFIPIDWKKVILWDEDGGLKIKSGNYYDYSGKEDRSPKMFVNHWDVCLSSEACAKVLNRRGISVHFCIDNDGTIYQLLDTQHGAWHCSSNAGNKNSVGVEIANAYYPKYQSWYVKNGLGERPIMSDAVVHGKKLEPFTWFYPEQIDALKALWKAMHIGLGMPLDYPSDSSGNLIETVYSECYKGSFEGFSNHYNFVRTKIDCAGLDLKALLGEVKRSPMYCVDNKK